MVGLAVLQSASCPEHVAGMGLRLPLLILPLQQDL